MFGRPTASFPVFPLEDAGLAYDLIDLEVLPLQGLKYYDRLTKLAHKQFLPQPGQDRNTNQHEHIILGLLVWLSENGIPHSQGVLKLERLGQHRYEPAMVKDRQI